MKTYFVGIALLSVLLLGGGCRPAPTPPAPEEEAQADRPVYGIPEPDKAGFIRSPYTPETGLIDVRGLPPGTKIRDPYNPGKTFLVP